MVVGIVDDRLAPAVEELRARSAKLVRLQAGNAAWAAASASPAWAASSRLACANGSPVAGFVAGANPGAPLDLPAADPGVERGESGGYCRRGRHTAILRPVPPKRPLGPARYASR